MKITIGCGCFAWLLFLIPVTFWTERNLNFWFTFFKHAPVHIPIWISFIITFVLNWGTLLLNAIGELLRYAI